MSIAGQHSDFKTGYTLGLDIGPNSVGWALIQGSEDARLIDCGSRVFPEGVDNFDTSKEESRNESRRIARGMRRQILRRRRRKRILRRALQSAGLWPVDPHEQSLLLQQDPYSLRRRALREALSPHEIGRVILHLNRRRGFLSNRKSDKGDKELKGMLAEISELAKEMGDKTLGEHFANKLGDDPRGRIRGKHKLRKMIHDEFDRIWNSQTKYHPTLLTESSRYGKAGPQQQPHRPMRLPKSGELLNEFGIEGIVFFQRRLRPIPASIVGMCELEKGERRCAKADRAAQRFRMLQEVNNLRYIDPAGNTEKSLDAEQRILLLDKLATTDKLKFDDIRKHLGFLDTIHFNLEGAKRTKIDGHKTDYLIAKAIGKSWHKRDESEKSAIIRSLIDSKLDDHALLNRLTEQFGFDRETAGNLANVDLPAGYVHVSLKAINKLLPFLEQGMRYMAESDPTRSAMHAAGYLRRDELQKRLFEKLPSLQFVRSGPLADLANPVVAAALHEVRKVVNAAIREYGQPDEIHIEMARSMKMNAEKRAEYNSRNREREEERDHAADYLREKQVPLSRESILRLMLWKQQAEKCIYTGKSIGFEQLFGGDIDVDHILPYSRTLDDSQANKIVCFHHANNEKGNQTPYEWLAVRDPQRHEEVRQRASILPYRTRLKFSQEKLELDDFIERQLRDTAYIARLAGEYLKMIVQKDHQVLGLKGQYTAELRHQWGLDNVLSELPDSPAWREQNNLRHGEKNRADHRHHAIDAIVVALTSRSRLQQLSRIRKAGGAKVNGESLPEPWPHFHQSIVDRIKAVRVSHRVRRKVAGKLHEETNYGPVHDQQGMVVDGTFVLRKPVEGLTPNEIESIRDKAIRKIVADAAQAALPLTDLKMPSGVPIKRVRLLKADKTIQPIRLKQSQTAGDPTQIAYVKPGSTHHLCIFEWTEKGKTRRDAVFVTMIEAARRVRDGETIIRRAHPERPDAKFVMSLSAGEMVLANWKGQEKLLVFKTAASTQGQIYFAEHSDARRSGDYRKHVCNCSTIDARKVTVDPLGRIRWAND
jgi:CRISPR-associated endonuclease Csn1